MSLRIRGLSAAQFEPLFVLDDGELSERGMRWIGVDAPRCASCRVMLEDAEAGERALLLTFAHQTAPSPYQAAGPIFVREGMLSTFDRVNELPPVFAGRLLAVRAYDVDAMMIHADVVDNDPRPLFGQYFADRYTDYLHVHYARRGCYSCRVERS